MFSNDILVEDEKYMKRALELAKKGEGYTSPNPMVGAVIVKDGKIIGEGYHERYGELHAERNALKNCIGSANNATMYVTLEPCCHYGKTPPCTEAIIENKISRVVIGCVDDNPLVDNKGVQILREHGIEVVTGVLEKECREINEVFFYYITTKMPFIVMKYAMTLDGKIATSTGDSKWISCDKSREHVHMLRKRYKGIMVGIGTVLSDNPMLDCRIEDGVNPIRIICDTNLRIPLDSNIVKTADKIKTIVAYCEKKNFENNNVVSNNRKYNEDVNISQKIDKLNEAGVQLLKIDFDNDKIDMKKLFVKLGEMGIDSILVEGGATIHGDLLKNKLVDKIYAYIAPKIVGGREALSPIGGEGLKIMNEALRLDKISMEKIEDDIVISGNIIKKYS